MKLVRQRGDNWHYQLDPAEFNLLKTILKKFPFTGLEPAEISRAVKDTKAEEREKLLNESLAKHRGELKKQAMNLMAGGKFAPGENECLLALNSEERDILLQILNDVRVGCWHSLGRPEIMELPKPGCSAQELARHNLINMAGYFEHGLLATKK